jgi:succinoglycan biosynthesis protein ExoA
MGRAIAAAFQSRWVVGGARSRDTDYEGEVDTVYLGCWPRATLARVGGFDETLVRNQDDEHNLRMRLAGARVWQSARIRSGYQPRGSLRRAVRAAAAVRLLAALRAAQTRTGRFGAAAGPYGFCSGLVALCAALRGFRAPGLVALLGAYARTCCWPRVLAARQAGTRTGSGCGGCPW